MNHQKVYDDIIEKAKSENRVKNKKSYYENHHILPKCLKGGNESENLVLLTSREHYVCHKLLTYIYKGNRSIIYAFHLMTYNRNRKVSSRDYEYAKKLRNETPMSKEQILKISESCKGLTSGNKGKIGQISWNKGVPCSEERKQHLRHPYKKRSKICA